MCCRRWWDYTNTMGHLKVGAANLVHKYMFITVEQKLTTGLLVNLVKCAAGGSFSEVLCITYFLQLHAFSCSNIWQEFIQCCQSKMQTKNSILYLHHYRNRAQHCNGIYKPFNKQNKDECLIRSLAASVYLRCFGCISSFHVLCRWCFSTSKCLCETSPRRALLTLIKLNKRGFYFSQLVFLEVSYTKCWISQPSLHIWNPSVYSFYCL